MRKWLRSPDSPYLLALAALFAVSRVVFRLVGVRFSTDQLRIAIQYLDPGLLRTHLAQSVWHLHTQPPLYNRIVIPIYRPRLLTTANGSSLHRLRSRPPSMFPAGP